MIRDALQYMVGKVVPGLAGLLFVTVFVRLAGKENYGKFALIFSVGNAAGVLAAGWLNQAQLRYYGRFQGAADLYRAILRRGLILSVGVLWLLTMLALGFAAIEGSLWQFWLTLLAALLATAMVLHGTLVALFQARIMPRQVVAIEFVRAVSSVALPLLLVVAWGNDYRSLAVGMVLAFLLPVVIFQPRAWPVGEGSSGCSCGTELKMFWSFGWPLSLWLSCMMLFQVVDRYLIQHFYGFDQTGVYASLYDLLIRFYSLVFFPVTMAVHPRIMAAWNAGDALGYARMLRLALSIQIGIFALVLLGFGALNLGFALRWAIPGMGSADEVLVVPLVAGGALWQIALLVHKPLEVLGETRAILGAILIALLVNMAINYYGLPRFGLVAAAFANVLGAVAYIGICMGHMYARRARLWTA